MTGAMTARSAAVAGAESRPERGRIVNLDILRGGAALAVLTVHAYALGGRSAPVRAAHLYDIGLTACASGVWAFFVLSGFVIAWPWVDALIGGRRLPHAGRYAARRAARILPLYWVVLTGIILLDGSAGTSAWQLPVHYLLLHNLVPGREEALFSPAWSLTVEFLFYALVPLLALAAARIARPAPERLARWLLVSWVASIAFTVVADLTGDGEIGLWLRGLLPAMWQMFCPGILLALAGHLDSPRWRRWVVDFPASRAAPLVALVAWCAAVLLEADAPLRYGIVPYQLLVDLARPLFALAYGLLVAWAIRTRPWRHRGLIELGLVSYGVYLLHPLLEAALLKLDWVPLHHDTLGAFVVHFALLVALTVPLAMISWRGFERPLISLAKRGGRTGATPDMRSFWNDRAQENALYFVDTRQDYRAPDPERFFAAEELLDYLLDGLGVALHGHERVLEIGCGLGRITRQLAARSASVIALDVSDEMLARARELNPQLQNVSWRLGDGRTLGGIPDGSIDACVSVVVLQHVPDATITLAYVREVGRVLARGGWAALQVSNDPAVHRPRDPLRQRLAALAGRAPRGQRHPAWLGSHVEIPDLRAAAAAGGAELTRVWGEGSQYCQVLLRRS